MRRRIRDLLPGPVRRALGGLVATRRARRLGRLSVPEAFDEIYRKGYWKQGEALSGVGSEGRWADDYCDIIAGLVRTHGLKSAVDAGCGDFSVGSRIAPLFGTYAALDVSAFIIDQNRRTFGHLTNVRFETRNLIEDDIPRADLVMVRQVLQHLTNAQILAVLETIDRSGAPMVLVAEEHPARDFIANRDLTGHSVLTRGDAGSGVDIRQPPFNRPATVIARLKQRPDPSATEPVLTLSLLDRRGSAGAT